MIAAWVDCAYWMPEYPSVMYSQVLKYELNDIYHFRSYACLCYVQTPKVFLCKLERNEKDVFSNCVSQVHAHRRALRVERTFIAPKYGLTFEKTLWYLFPRVVRSSVLIRVKELNPFNSGPDHVRSLRARKRRREVVGFDYTKWERFSLTFKIYWVKQSIWNISNYWVSAIHYQRIRRFLQTYLYVNV